MNELNEIYKKANDLFTDITSAYNSYLKANGIRTTAELNEERANNEQFKVIEELIMDMGEKLALLYELEKTTKGKE